MEWGDLLTIALVFVALWTFLPRHIRRALRSGLNPAVATLADAVREVTRYALKGLTVVAYRGLLGVPVPSVKSEDVGGEIGDVALPATTPQNNNNSIATPATDTNALLFQNTAKNLAIAVKAGKMGETEGIKLYFDVSPSSSNPRYLAARAALKTELEKLNNPYPNMSPEQKRAREALGLSK